MMPIGSTNSQRPPVASAPRPHPASNRDDDVSAIRTAFSKAQGSDEPRPLKGGKDARLLKRDPQGGRAGEMQTAPEQDPAEAELAVRPRDDRRTGAYGEKDQDQQSGGAFATTAPAPPIAMSDMPAPHVDPAVFAQLMGQLWLREKAKGAKEVRVTFGNDAWPATGARLVRNAAGSLDVELHVGDGGALYEGATLTGLGDALGERGLAIGSVRLVEGAVA